MTHRTFFIALAAGLFAVAAPAGAQRGADSAAKKDTMWSGARSEARAHATADSLRAAILRLSSFAGFSANDSTCAMGDVRTFEKDTTERSRDLLASLERLVIAYGAFQIIDNPSGHALLREVVRLETGGPGPRWDVASGHAPRAFNPMLPGRALNPTTKVCERTPGIAPDGVVLPPVTNLAVPHDSGAVTFVVGYGFEGMNSLRDFFFAQHRNDSTAVLHDARVNAYAIWQDYGIVSVVRESQLRGVVPLPKELLGTVYAFHKVGAEWRLLAIVRTW
jgi:hypothetical protein